MAASSLRPVTGWDRHTGSLTGCLRPFDCFSLVMLIAFGYRGCSKPLPVKPHLSALRSYGQLHLAIKDAPCHLHQNTLVSESKPELDPQKPHFCDVFIHGWITYRAPFRWLLFSVEGIHARVLRTTKREHLGGVKAAPRSGCRGGLGGPFVTKRWGTV